MKSEVGYGLSIFLLFPTLCKISFPYQRNMVDTATIIFEILGIGGLL